MNRCIFDLQTNLLYILVFYLGVDCKGFQCEGQSMVRRNDYRVIACLENKQPYKKTQNGNENARKESGPESGHLEAGHH